MQLEKIMNNEKSFFSRLKNKITPYVLSLSILAGAYFSCNLNPIAPPVERKKTRLNFDLKLNKDLYEFTEPVNIEYTVKNIRSDDAVLEFNEPDREFNYSIYQGNKFIHSNELEIDSLAQLITSSDSSSTYLTIKPNESVTFKGTWDQKHLRYGHPYYVDPGGYNLRVKLNGLDNIILERSSELLSEFQIFKEDYDLEGRTKIAYALYNQIYVMNIDGSNKTRLTNTGFQLEDGGNMYPSWSPDGSKIAFVGGSYPNSEIYVMNADGSKIAFGGGEIYVMNADGSNITNLTNNPASDGNPSWSSDGSKIAFHSYRDGDAEIYVMNADGSNQVNLTNNSAGDYHPDWSPDGSKIAFYSNRDDEKSLYVMNADGSNPTSLHCFGLYPSWSPDSYKIAFEYSSKGRIGGIAIINFDGSNKIILTPIRPSYPYKTGSATNVLYIQNPSWSPFLK